MRENLIFLTIASAVVATVLALFPVFENVTENAHNHTHVGETK